MKHRMKISSRTTGITLTNLSVQECTDIHTLLVGKEGVTRITTEWDAPDKEPKDEPCTCACTPCICITPPTDQVLISDDTMPADVITSTNYTVAIEPDPECAQTTQPQPEPTIQQEAEEDPETEPQTELQALQQFYETGVPIPRQGSKAHIGEQLTTDKPSLTYYDHDGKLIIQYGTNRIYTTWDLIERLPVPVPMELLKGLNSQKAMGVRAFRLWMDRTKLEKVTPDPTTFEATDDPDAPFRKMLNQDTHTGYDGGKIEGSLEP